MAYTPQMNTDAKTRDGQRATFVKYSDSYWPAPWVFEVDGVECAYSIGGFYNNHWLAEHPLDLIETYDPIAEVPIS